MLAKVEQENEDEEVSLWIITEDLNRLNRKKMLERDGLLIRSVEKNSYVGKSRTGE